MSENSINQLKSKLCCLHKIGSLDNWFRGEEIFISIKHSIAKNFIIVNNPKIKSDNSPSNFLELNLDNFPTELNSISFLIHFLVQNTVNCQCALLINHTDVVKISQNGIGLIPISQESLLLKSHEIVEIEFYELVNEFFTKFNSSDEDSIFDLLMKYQIKVNAAMLKNNKIFIKNVGCLVTGRTIEEAWFEGMLVVYACKTQVKLSHCIHSKNIVFPSEESKNAIKTILLDGTSNVVLINNQKSELRWLAGELEFEATMRQLEYSENITGYDFKLKNIWK